MNIQQHVFYASIAFCNAFFHSFSFAAYFGVNSGHVNYECTNGSLVLQNAISLFSEGARNIFFSLFELSRCGAFNDFFSCVTFGKGWKVFEKMFQFLKKNIENTFLKFILKKKLDI
jgi:hypothetical protein